MSEQNETYLRVVVEAIAAVRSHVTAGSNDSLRREALARLYDAVLELSSNDPAWNEARNQRVNHENTNYLPRN